MRPRCWGCGFLHPEYRGRCQCRICAKCTGDSNKESDRAEIEPIDGDQGTPKNIIDKLNRAAVDTLSDPSMHHKLAARGFKPREQQTPEALGAYQKAEIEKRWPI